MSYSYEYPNPMDTVHQQTSEHDPAHDYVQHGYHAQKQEKSPEYPTVVTLPSLPSPTNLEGMLSTVQRNQPFSEEETHEENEKHVEDENEMDEEQPTTPNV